MADAAHGSTEGKTKIEAPNGEYTGTGPYGLVFLSGTAYTADPVAADYCARHGYKVSGPQAPEIKPATVAEDPQTVRLGAQRLSAPPEDASASQAMTDEQRRDAYGEGVGALLETGPGTPPMIGPGRVEYENAEAQGIEPEQVTRPGGTEQVGLTRDQADYSARVRAGLIGPGDRPPPEPKATRKRKTTSRKKSTRKSTARKSSGSKSGKSGGKE